MCPANAESPFLTCQLVVVQPKLLQVGEASQLLGDGSCAKQYSGKTSRRIK